MIHNLSRAAIATALLAGLGTGQFFTARAADIQLTDADVGACSLAGSTTVTNSTSGGKVYVVVGGGSDIWGNADSFHYAYMPVKGNFDYVVRVQDLQGPDAWTKAELMARVDDGSGMPQAGDPFIAGMVTRPAGQNQIGPQIRTERDGLADWTSPTGTPRPIFPDTWLRMERLGNVFYQYYSTNGTDWNLWRPFGGTLDTAGSTPPAGDNQTVFTNAWPTTVLFGLAVTAHNDSDATGGIGVFSDFAAHTTIPIAIKTQPAATVSIAANTTLELSVATTGDPIHYQWRKNGVDIAGAIEATYQIELAQTTDSGTYSVRLYGAGNEVISANSIVTITQDVTPPTLASVTSDATLIGVRVKFSEPVTATAEAKANYTLDGGATVTGVTRVDTYTVTLTTSKLAEGATYTLTVNGVKDTANNSIQANSKATFKTYIWVPGVVMQKYWDALNTTTIAALTSDSRYPNQPTTVTFEPLFEYPPSGATSYADYYGNQLVAWFVPPETGDYVFYLSSDDYSTLYLSPDASPDNAVAIATETAWSNPREWLSSSGSSTLESKRSDQYAGTQWPYGGTISLVKGNRYFLQALHAEGGGGDNVGVTYSLASVGDPEDLSASALTGDKVGVLIDPTGASVAFTQQPKDTTTPQYRTATFEGAAAGVWTYGTNVTYQWQMAPAGSAAFTNITGATKAAYTTPLLPLAESGGQYRLVASVPTLSVTSSVAKVTVSSDNIAPTAICAGAIKGSTLAGVQFDELMDATSAQIASNYQVNGATVTAAILHLGKYVELQFASAISSSLSVTVKNVKDLAGNPVADTTLTGTISTMTSVDIGNPGSDPLQPGYSVALGNEGYLVAGGGSDIWGTADACQFLYKEFTGAFDLRVRVEGMNPMGLSTWAKAELMSRESTAPGSRHSSVCTTRADGTNLIDPQFRDATDVDATEGTQITPVPYPNCWLRLVRENATSGEIKFYLSTDGVSWTLKNTHTTPATDPDPAYPSKLLVGLAVTSHDNTGNDALGEAVFQSFSVKTYTPTVDPQLAIAHTNGKAVITWVSGTLVSSPTVNGTYAPITGATSPYSVTPEAGKAVFYRIQQ
jgi:hypothetical protein